MKTTSFFLILAIAIAASTQVSCKGGAFVEEEGKSGLLNFGEADNFQAMQVPDSLFAEIGRGLKMAVVSEGEGPLVKSGNSVSVHYIGTFPDGKEFDNSVKRKEALSFIPGKGQVIEGWEMALPKLKMGSKAVLIVPPHLAYGEKGSPPLIPANATLVFHIFVLGQF